MSLQPHQQRVVEEKTALDEKLTKLVAFYDTPLYAKLDTAEKVRLQRQGQAMSEYADILEERIAAFPPEIV